MDSNNSTWTAISPRRPLKSSANVQTRVSEKFSNFNTKFQNSNLEGCHPKKIFTSRRHLDFSDSKKSKDCCLKVDSAYRPIHDRFSLSSLSKGIEQKLSKNATACGIEVHHHDAGQFIKSSKKFTKHISRKESTNEEVKQQKSVEVNMLSSSRVVGTDHNVTRKRPRSISIINEVYSPEPKKPCLIDLTIDDTDSDTDSTCVIDLIESSDLKDDCVLNSNRKKKRTPSSVTTDAELTPELHPYRKKSCKKWCSLSPSRKSLSVKKTQFYFPAVGIAHNRDKNCHEKTPPLEDSLITPPLWITRIIPGDQSDLHDFTLDLSTDSDTEEEGTESRVRSCDGVSGDRIGERKEETAVMNFEAVVESSERPLSGEVEEGISEAVDHLEDRKNLSPVEGMKCVHDHQTHQVLPSDGVMQPSWKWTPIDEIRDLMGSRGIPYIEINKASTPVKLVSSCILDNKLEQDTHLPSLRLYSLVEYLRLVTTPLRMPRAGVLIGLWKLLVEPKEQEECYLQSEARDISVVYLRNLLAIHPPGQHKLVDQQYSQFIKKLASQGITENDFSLWEQIEKLLKSKSLSSLVSFLIDLLIADFWAALNTNRSDAPLFTSVFWTSPSANHVTMPIRILIENIAQMMKLWNNSLEEIDHQKNLMALLYMSGTVCSDMSTELILACNKFSRTSLVNFTSCIYSNSLHLKLVQSLPELRKLYSYYKSIVNLDTGEFSKYVKSVSLTSMQVQEPRRKDMLRGVKCFSTSQTVSLAPVGMKAPKHSKSVDSSCLDYTQNREQSVGVNQQTHTHKIKSHKKNGELDPKRVTKDNTKVPSVIHKGDPYHNVTIRRPKHIHLPVPKILKQPGPSSSKHIHSLVPKTLKQSGPSSSHSPVPKTLKQSGPSSSHLPVPKTLKQPGPSSSKHIHSPVPKTLKQPGVLSSKHIHSPMPKTLKQPSPSSSKHIHSPMPKTLKQPSPSPSKHIHSPVPKSPKLTTNLGLSPTHSKALIQSTDSKTSPSISSVCIGNKSPHSLKHSTSKQTHFSVLKTQEQTELSTHKPTHSSVSARSKPTHSSTIKIPRHSTCKQTYFSVLKTQEQTELSTHSSASAKVKVIHSSVSATRPSTLKISCIQQTPAVNHMSKVESAGPLTIVNTARKKGVGNGAAISKVCSKTAEKTKHREFLWSMW